MSDRLFAVSLRYCGTVDTGTLLVSEIGTSQWILNSSMRSLFTGLSHLRERRINRRVSQKSLSSMADSLIIKIIIIIKCKVRASGAVCGIEICVTFYASIIWWLYDEKMPEDVREDQEPDNFSYTTLFFHLTHTGIMVKKLWCHYWDWKFIMLEWG